MIDFQGQFTKFEINEELRSKFLEFETIWQTIDVKKKIYKVITVVNNDTTVSEQKLKERNNAKLA